MTPLIEYYYKQDKETQKVLADTYHKWVELLDCCISGSSSVGKPHHVRLAGWCGMGQKPVNLFEIPITNEFHVEIHTQGAKTFQLAHDVDFIDIITELNAQFCYEEGIDA